TLRPTPSMLPHASYHQQPTSPPNNSTLSLHDALPILESRKPIGIVTDRDIVTRLIATGRNPLEARAADAMTKNTVTINADANVSDAVNRMEDHQIRRILVVDNDGRCVGILAQADVALHAEHEVNELVSEVSEKSRTRQQ